jgi:hypothetical protein
MVKLTEKKLFKILLFITLLLIPVILFILPSNFFDHGESVCISMMLFDVKCYGCGMTRAVMHFIHFDFNEAIAYNKLVILVLPLLILWWLKTILSLTGKKILRWF